METVFHKTNERNSLLAFFKLNFNAARMFFGLLFLSITLSQFVVKNQRLLIN